MKALVFADPHICSRDFVGKRRPALSPRKLTEMLAALPDADLLICLGDLVASDLTPELDRASFDTVRGIFGGFAGRKMCCMGNHDSELWSREEFSALSGFETAPALIDAGSSRLIFLDANFYPDTMLPYRPREVDWTRCALPPRQLEFLRESLKCSRDCRIFLHQCLDPAVEARHILANAGEVNAVIREAGNVSAVWQGHFHAGLESEYGGIKYITLPAVCDGDGPAPFRVAEL